MRLTPAALIIAVVAFTPASAAAQAVQSFQDLRQRIEVGNKLRVQDRSGQETTGRLTAITVDQITLQTAAGERRFPQDTVASVAVRRSYAKRGALIGAGVGAVLGIPDSDPDAPVLTGLLGAGAGAIAGALIPRMTTVYSTAGRKASVAPIASPGRIGVVVTIGG